MDSDGAFSFPAKLKKGKPVSQVKLVFMGKTMVRVVQSVCGTESLWYRVCVVQSVTIK